LWGVAKLVTICFYFRKISLNLPRPGYIWIQIKGEGIKGFMIIWDQGLVQGDCCQIKVTQKALEIF